MLRTLFVFLPALIWLAPAEAAIEAVTIGLEGIQGW